MRFVIFSALSLALAGPAWSQTDALAGVVLPAGFSPADLRGGVTVTTREVQGKNQRNYVAAYDPAKPEGRRWTLVSLNGAAPTADGQARWAPRLAKKGAPATYSDVAKYLGVSPAVVGEDASHLTLRQDALPVRAVIVNDTDVSQHFTALIRVNKSSPQRFIESVEFTAKQPFKMGPAKVSAAKGQITYAYAGRGRPPVTARTSFAADVGMLFGRMHIETTENFSGHTPPTSS